MSKFKTWFFTWNNPTKDDEELSRALSLANSKFMFQLEVGKTGTRHYQGVVKFVSPRPFETVKTLISAHAHIEKTKNFKAAVAYCSKEDTREDGPWSNMSEEEIAKCKPKEVVKVKDPLEGKELFAWQKDLMKILKKEPDERAVYWLWEPVGNTGKTTFAKSYCIKNKDAIVVTGKASDVKCGIAQCETKPRVVFWNLVRSQEEYVSFQGIEEVKDGFFFSPKYESGMVMMNAPHVVVFANFAPNTEKLSADRWHIRNIGDRGPFGALPGAFV